MNRDEATKLDGRIRRMARESKGHLDTLAKLVDQAKAGRIHEALEYRSWTAYLADALSDLCSSQGMETRRELVSYLYDIGMSQRAIAQATGVNQSTISRDLESAAQVMLDASPDSEDDGDSLGRGFQPGYDVHDGGEAQAKDPVSADDRAETKENATTGLDGKNQTRNRKKRSKGQGRQEKPALSQHENHAKGLAALLDETLDPAAEALKALIPGELDESVTPDMAMDLADRIELDMAASTRVHGLLMHRSGSSTTE